MFNKICFAVVILFSAFSFSQINILEEYKSNPKIEVKILDENILEIYNKHLEHTYRKNISALPVYDNTSEANLIISLDTINFSTYDNYYRYWGNVPATNPLGKYIIVDANRNDKQEIYLEYVHREDFNNPYSVIRIYENTLDSIFNNIYEFPTDTLGDVFDIGDITEDGLFDIICRGTKNNIRFFKQNTANDLIVESNLDYNPFPIVYQPNDVTFYDIDGDSVQEIIYYLFAGDGDSLWAYSNHIAKYNSQINNYELIYYHRPQPEYFTSGISIGDFDQDGRGNFATGSIGGKMYIYEHVQDNQYQVEYEKQLETFNAFLTTMTEDMDGNGKPELWLGSDFSSGLYGGVTRLFAFEAMSPGNYVQVYQIDIRGLFSAIYGNLNYVDLDGNGDKELFLTNANLAFGFKYNGNGNYYMDFIKVMPRLDSVYVYQFLEAVDVADLDVDGIVEVIPQYTLNKGWPESWENRSVFLKRNKITNVDEPNNYLPAEFALMQNYPNPFNPSTTLKFYLPAESKVVIRVFDILGKEIKELINDTRISGEYEILWNGTNSNENKVSSGVYFITMEAYSKNSLNMVFYKTIKSILIK